MKRELETGIQNDLQPAPMAASLERKLRAMAGHIPSRARWWKAGYSIPLAATAAVAVVATTMLPAKASAKSYGLIVAAAQRVNAFQFSIVSNEGPKRNVFTIAGNDGHVVLHGDEGESVEFGDGTMSVYDAAEKKVVRFKFGNLGGLETVAREVQSGVAEGMKEMDLNKMLHDYEAKYGPGGIRISPVTREGGQSVYHVTLAKRD